MSCFVYLIQNKSGNVKIGYADDPYQRLGSVKTGSAEKVALHTIIKCKDRPTAQQLEAFLHRYYDKYRMNGEWFAVDVSNIIFDLEFVLGLSKSVLGTTNFDVMFEEDQPKLNTEDNPPKLKRRNTREIVRSHFEKHPKDIDKDISEIAIKLNVRKSIVQEVRSDFIRFRNFARSIAPTTYRARIRED